MDSPWLLILGLRMAHSHRQTGRQGTLACWLHCTAFKMQDMRHRSFPTFNISLLSYYYIMVMLFSWTLTNGTKSLQSSWTTVQEANFSSFLNSEMSSQVPFLSCSRCFSREYQNTVIKFMLSPLFPVSENLQPVSMELILLPTLLRYFQ